MSRALRSFCLTLLFLSVAAVPYINAQTPPPDTTRSSACHGTTEQPEPGCSGKFIGMVDPISGKVFNQSANNSDGAAREISAAPLYQRYVDSTALQSGTGRPVFAHLQPWFQVATSSQTYPVPNFENDADNGARGLKQVDNHVQIGYDSSHCDVVNRQLTDMQNRGFAGPIVNWYGPYKSTFGTFRFEERTTQAWQSSLNGTTFGGGNNCPNRSSSLKFALMEDQGAWSEGNWQGADPNQGYSSVGPCSPTGTNSACITNHIRNNMIYANNGYTNQPTYLKVDFTTKQMSSAAISRALWFTFVDEDGWTGVTWSTVWQDARDFGGTRNPPNELMFRDHTTGFTKFCTSTTQNCGNAFAWVRSNTRQNDPTGDPQIGYTHLSGFYDAAQSHPQALAFGASWKGFNESKSAMLNNENRLTEQKCGHVWRKTLYEISGARSTSVVPFLQLATWNDYDEGTEIESGIDNCVGAVTAVSTDCAGKQCVRWSTSFSEDGNEQTIAYYRIDTVNFNGTVRPDVHRVYPKLGSSQEYVYAAHSGSYDESTYVVDSTGTYPKTYSKVNERFWIYQDTQWNEPNFWFYVTAVGLNSMKNQRSNSVDIHPSNGSITISGELQSYTYDAGGWYEEIGGCTQSGHCMETQLIYHPNYQTHYDSGTITATVLGVTKTVSYGEGSSRESIAETIVNAFNQDSNSPVNAYRSGADACFTSKQNGGNKNQPAGSSVTYDSGSFGSSSFSTSNAGMAGGSG